MWLPDAHQGTPPSVVFLELMYSQSGLESLELGIKMLIQFPRALSPRLAVFDTAGRSVMPLPALSEAAYKYTRASAFPYLLP